MYLYYNFLFFVPFRQAVGTIVLFEVKINTRFFRLFLLLFSFLLHQQKKKKKKMAEERAYKPALRDDTLCLEN
uniref:Uncharacterized protein n=1 Tax=Panstrongylus lignarius TaxID=156445 RepID=A0A224Y4B0_9HEMI